MVEAGPLRLIVPVMIALLISVSAPPEVCMALPVVAADRLSTVPELMIEIG